MPAPSHRSPGETGQRQGKHMTSALCGAERARGPESMAPTGLIMTRWGNPTRSNETEKDGGREKQSGTGRLEEKERSKHSAKETKALSPQDHSFLGPSKKFWTVHK